MALQLAVAFSARGADLEKLSESLRSGDVPARRHALFVIGTLGAEAAGTRPLAEAALQDADPKVRWLAGWALEQIDGAPANIAAVAAPPPEPEDLQVLIDALGSEDDIERASAAQAIGQRGPAAAEAVPALQRALVDSNWLVRQRAAESLGRVGPQAEEAIKILLQRLEDEPSDTVRQEIIAALRRRGPSTNDVVEPVQDRNPFPDLPKQRRRRAFRLVRSLAESSDLRLYVALLQDREAAVRRRAARALFESGAVAFGTLPALRRALTDSDLQVRLAAARAYDWVWDAMDQELHSGQSPEIGPPQAAGSVLAYANLLQDENANTRLLAVEMLWLKSQRDDVAAAVPQLTNALHDDSAQIRVLAGAVLSRNRSPVKKATP